MNTLQNRLSLEDDYRSAVQLFKNRKQVIEIVPASKLMSEVENGRKERAGRKD